MQPDVGHVGHVDGMSVSGYRGCRSNPGISMLCPSGRHFIRIASVDSAVTLVPGWDNIVKGVQCYEHFGGMALKNYVVFLYFRYCNTLLEV